MLCERDDNDSDEDGLTGSAKSRYNTDANKADTDGDELSDGAEVHAMLFNSSPTSSETDGNAVADPIDLVYPLLEQVSADPCLSDINKDGMVTAADRLVFLTDFGVICD